MKRSAVSVVLLMTVVVAMQGAGPVASRGDIIDLCNCTVASNGGVVLVCPGGDGDPLGNAVGGVDATITLTARDVTNTPVAGLPATDMWLVGCSDGLLLCGGSQGSNPDGATDANGLATFSNEPRSGGCDTGLLVVIQGEIVKQPCGQVCLPVSARSPDYKSSGAPGPTPCGGDLPCPDGRVSSADFSWLVTHYKSAVNPSPPYHACADYASPLGGQLTLADFSKFATHFANGHQCAV